MSCYPVSYNVDMFPAFAKLIDSPLLDQFIQEGLRVLKEVPVDYGLQRKYEEWDEPSKMQRFKDAIQEKKNTCWTVAQGNKDWLNFPFMYYDVSMGGKAEELCPSIMAFLREIGHVRIAGLSLLKKGGRLKPHKDSTGRSNDALACHICLIGNGDLTVSGQLLQQRPKQIIIFDAEHEHSLKSVGEMDRVIFYIDFTYSKHVHPDYVKKVRILQRTRL